MSESESEPLVTVATFNSLFHAELAQGALEEAGIESFVSDGEVVSTFSGLTGGVKLQVPKSHFLEAERILSKQEARARRQAFDDYGLSKPSEGITSDPIRVRETPEDLEDGDEFPVNEADDTVDRAMKVAIFGLLLFPPLLHLYSLWLLLQLTSISASVSPHKRFKLFATLVLDVAMLFGGMCIWPMCLAPARYW